MFNCVHLVMYAIVNCVPLSETMVSGRPYLARCSCKNLTLTVDVDFLHLHISGISVKLSTTIRKYDRFNGSAIRK